ncbi:hypothetical protein LguiB_004036 [Lonicera macranthoides]
MGRPPCCDKVGVKKGPWTPEEDIILVSYIQDHGPGNWRSVPTNTGLLRCSKSCRLRWTNYLRPGIKRGNFTPHEEGMIIHLQALLGNKWAAIASYLPQRTDNDIKNYWNTHLKKKIKRFQSSSSSTLSFDHEMASDSRIITPKSLFGEKRKNEDDMIMSEHEDAPNNTNTTLRLNHNSSLYASSTENISRLLEGWMRSSPQKNNSSDNNNNNINNSASFPIGSQENRVENPEEGGGDLISNEEFDSIMCFDNLNTTTSTGNNEWLPNHKSQAVAGGGGSETDGVEDKAAAFFVHERKQIRQENNPPLSILEKWLLDENAAHVEEMMELPLIF